MKFSTVKEKIKQMLIWSQKYTKTDMLYLAKGGFWLLNEQVLTSFGLFIIAIIFARYVPKEIYGTYKFILSLWGIVNAFSLTGMNGAVTQAVAKGFEKTLNRALIVQLKWSVIIPIIGLSLALYYFWNNNIVIAVSCLIFSVFTPVTNVSNTFIAYLNGKKEFKRLAIYNSVVILGTNALPLIFVLLYPQVLTLVLLYFASAALLNFFFLKYSIAKLPPQGHTDESFIKFGKHLSLIYVISIIALYIDRVMVFHFLGAAELAIYSFALVMPDQLRGLLKIVSTLALPKLSLKTEKNLHEGLFRRLLIIFSASAVIMAVYYIAAPLLFKIFFPQYQEAVYLSRLFAIATIFGGVVVYVGTLLQTQIGKVADYYKYNIYGSLLRSVSLVLGVYFYGVVGAVAATGIYYVFSIVYGIILIITSKPKNTANGQPGVPAQASIN